jgi:hypothetical protein
MKCITCGTGSAATAELGGIIASFCCDHIPFGKARIKMFVEC